MSEWATTANMDTIFEPLTQRSELVPEGPLPDDSVQAEVAAAAAEAYHAAANTVQRIRKKLTKKLTKLNNHVRPPGVASKEDAVKRQLKASVARLRERLNTAVLATNAAKKAMNEAEASFGIRFATIPANLPSFHLPKDRGSITPKAISDFLGKLSGVLNTHQFPKVQYGSNRWSKLLAIVFTNTTVEERQAISALGAQPWEQAHANVIQQLANQSGKGEICRQFVSMRQKAGESVVGYTKRFNEMWHRVEKDIVAYLYLNSLQEDVRSKVLQDSTFEEYESDIPELERRAIQAHASLRRARNFSNNTATSGDLVSLRDKRRVGKGGGKSKGGATSNNASPIGDATRDGTAIGTGGAKQDICSRCRKKHTGGPAKCRSVFDIDGQLIPNRPQGKPKDWVNQYTGCHHCGSKSHAKWACDTLKAPSAAPTDERKRAVIRAILSQASAEELAPPTKRVRTSPEMLTYVSEHRPCWICNNGSTHTLTDCPMLAGIDDGPEVTFVDE
jgi:hypothetical protein